MSFSLYELLDDPASRKGVRNDFIVVITLAAAVGNSARGKFLERV
jgi:hypothetical protein